MVKSDVFEALGAALIVSGVSIWLGLAAGLITAGAAFIVKAVSVDVGEP